MRRSYVHFYSKQYHTTSLLDATDSMRNLRYHIRQKWRGFVETMTKLWRTIPGIDGRAKREVEKEAITFNGSLFSSSKQLATKFNQQFNASKLDRHTSSRETRVLTRETKRKPFKRVRRFTADLVMTAIKN